jgi:hypothetical protein
MAPKNVVGGFVLLSSGWASLKVVELSESHMAHTSQVY